MLISMSENESNVLCVCLLFAFIYRTSKQVIYDFFVCTYRRSRQVIYDLFKQIKQYFAFIIRL